MRIKIREWSIIKKNTRRETIGKAAGNENYIL